VQNEGDSNRQDAKAPRNKKAGARAGLEGFLPLIDLYGFWRLGGSNSAL
jgi:hypothetical protein